MPQPTTHTDTGAAVRATLRSSGPWIAVAVLAAWAVATVLLAPDDDPGVWYLISASGATVIFVGAVHQMVRRRQGYDVLPYTSALYAGVAALAVMLVVDAVEPAMTLGEILGLTAAWTFISAVLVWRERFVARRNPPVRRRQSGRVGPT